MPVLPDLLWPGLAVVFCGTGAGPVSARRGAYYAGPGNRFWPTLFETGLTPTFMQPEQFPQLLDLGIGLTDIAKEHVGPDSVLETRHVDAAALGARIAGVAPRHLAFTSKMAASFFLNRPTGAIAYGRQNDLLGETAIHVLPSPSGAARRYWCVEPWADLARCVMQEKDGK